MLVALFFGGTFIAGPIALLLTERVLPSMVIGGLLVAVGVTLTNSNAGK